MVGEQSINTTEYKNNDKNKNLDSVKNHMAAHVGGTHARAHEGFWRWSQMKFKDSSLPVA